ncbi:unnamed protein product [Linum trigynum]|uniref:Uncharacterized protein n=1 Tax=Linum trigynum TaxID=586398 RepID=A0AAV2EEZ8_9ROSI
MAFVPLVLLLVPRAFCRAEASVENLRQRIIPAPFKLDQVMNEIEVHGNVYTLALLEIYARLAGAEKAYNDLVVEEKFSSHVIDVIVAQHNATIAATVAALPSPLHESVADVQQVQPHAVLGLHLLVLGVGQDHLLVLGVVGLNLVVLGVLGLNLVVLGLHLVLDAGRGPPDLGRRRRGPPDADPQCGA